MPNDRMVRPFYGLFPSLVEREGEEMIHDEGLLARFWGAWSDACMVCWNMMAADIANENPFARQHQDRHADSSPRGSTRGR
jgi:hypothetical protein